MNLKLLVSLISILLLSACGITENGSVASNKEAVTATKTSQIKPTLTSTLEPASTETPTLPPTNTLPPTFTFTPSPTSTSTATVTPSPTPIPIAIVEVSLANIYSGVAIYAPVVAVFAEDTPLRYWVLHPMIVGC